MYCIFYSSNNLITCFPCLLNELQDLDLPDASSLSSGDGFNDDRSMTSQHLVPRLAAVKIERENRIPAISGAFFTKGKM